MNEKIKDKLYEEYLWKLREEIKYDEFFHVDVEIKSKGSVFCFGVYVIRRRWRGGLYRLRSA